MSHIRSGQRLKAAQLNAIAHQGTRLIEERVLENSAPAVEFADIPQGFNNLKVLITGGMVTTSSQVYLTFNGDTAANYRYAIYLLRASGAHSAFTRTAAPVVEVAYLESSSLMNSSTVNVSGYSRTDREKLLYAQYFFGIESTADADVTVNHVQGWWKSTAAITSIHLDAGTDAFAAGSIVQLYGLGYLGA